MSQTTSRYVRLSFVALALLVATPSSSESLDHAFEAVSGQAVADLQSVVSPMPDWLVVALATASLGSSVDTAGDVNGDGYDDIIVAAPAHQLPGARGAVMVYHGSSSGPSLTPDWMVTGTSSVAAFGYKVATAGDVNADGYDDVLVNQLYLVPDRVFLYLGSASGLSTTAAWTGLGPKRRRTLLRHFGGLKGGQNAAVEDLAAVAGIGPQLARTIYDYFH